MLAGARQTRILQKLNNQKKGKSMSKQTENQIKADAVNEFVCSMIGALESGFIESNTITLATIHRVAQNHCKGSYGVALPHIVEQWGEDVAILCGLNKEGRV